MDLPLDHADVLRISSVPLSRPAECRSTRANSDVISERRCSPTRNSVGSLDGESRRVGESQKPGFAGSLPAAKARMVRLMADEGLPYCDRTMTFNSRLAQELAKWTETQQPNGDVHGALFRAYFVDGVNLAKIENVLPVAKSLGLPADKDREILTTRQFREAVDADWQRSRKLGVTGVPTFVVGMQ